MIKLKWVLMLIDLTFQINYKTDLLIIAKISKALIVWK